jgi:hypothetical protein
MGHGQRKQRGAGDFKYSNTDGSSHGRSVGKAAARRI